MLRIDRLNELREEIQRLAASGQMDCDSMMASIERFGKRDESLSPLFLSLPVERVRPIYQELEDVLFCFELLLPEPSRPVQVLSTSPDPEFGLFVEKLRLMMKRIHSLDEPKAFRMAFIQIMYREFDCILERVEKPASSGKKTAFIHRECTPANWN